MEKKVKVGGAMLFNATFANISVISWRSVLLVEETGVPGGNRSTWRKPPTWCKSLTKFITEGCIEYLSPLAIFELTTLVVTGTECIGSCKSNYHTITTTTVLKRK
jgi:hypothetical protein